MAFNVNDYMTGGFDISSLSTMEEYKEAAIALAQAEVVPPAIKDWAKQALWILNGAGSGRPPESLDASYGEGAGTFEDQIIRWMSGDAQPTKARSAVQSYTEDIAEAQASLNNELANLANQLDFSALSPEQVEAELANADVYTDRINAIQTQIDALNEFGIDTSSYTSAIESAQSTISGPTEEAAGTQLEAEGIVKDEETGSFFSEEEAAAVDEQQAQAELGAAGIRAGAEGRTAPRMRAEQQPDGTFNLIDSTTGQVVEGGFTDITEARSRLTFLQSGAVPDAIGAFDTGTADGTRTLDSGATLTGEGTATAGTATGAGDASSQFVSGAESLVQQQEQAALQQNPNLQITPEMRAEWLGQAYDELRQNRFFQEVIRNAEFDLGTSLQRLVEDTRLREIGIAESHRRGLQQTQTGLQERGMLFGGVRETEERDLAAQTNLQLTGLGSQFQRGLQDIGTAAERQLGTEAVTGLAPTFGNTQEVGRVIAGSPVYTPGTDINLLEPIGGSYGDIQRDITTEAQTRAGELEGAFGDQFTQYA